VNTARIKRKRDCLEGFLTFFFKNNQVHCFKGFVRRQRLVEVMENIMGQTGFSDSFSLTGTGFNVLGTRPPRGNLTETRIGNLSFCLIWKVIV
jgi:hypothetical protein